MKNFFRKILIKITGIGWCDTPNIQIEKVKIEANKIVNRDSTTFNDKSNN